MRSKLPQLSIELNKRLHEALLDCGNFKNILQSLTTPGELLEPYHLWFREHENDSINELVKSSIRYLVKQSGNKPVFTLFLKRMHSELAEDNPVRDELKDLYEEVEQEIGYMHLYQAQFSIQSGEEIHSKTDLYEFSSIGLITKEEVINDDYGWMISTITTIIEPKGKEGRKNLLRGALPRESIEHLELDRGGPRDVAGAMIAALEARDRLGGEFHALEIFLKRVVKMDELENTEVEERFDIFISKYNMNRKKKSRYDQMHHYEENIIVKRLEEKKAVLQMKPASQYFNFDVSVMNDCNLHEQKKLFWENFEGKYDGLFTFTVANTHRDILDKYVIESLVNLVRVRIERPIDYIRHIFLSPDYLNVLSFSSIDQGTIYLQQEIEKQLPGRSLTELLMNNRGTNLVIVIWHSNISSGLFKHIVPDFLERLKNQITGILKHQEQCLLLFWANYGSSPPETLDMVNVLPVFDQFEVNSLISWLEYEIPRQLRKVNVPENEIQDCKGKIIEKVKYFEGRLPETYMVLRRFLEQGGVV